MDRDVEVELINLINAVSLLTKRVNELEDKLESIKPPLGGGPY